MFNFSGTTTGQELYRRSDALEKRRNLMETWASYREPKISANILQMHRRARQSATKKP